MSIHPNEKFHTRLAAATRLKQLGLSWDVIASITGHDTAEMVAYYTEQKRKAQIAIGTLNAATADNAEQRVIGSVKPIAENCKAGETTV